METTPLVAGGVYVSAQPRRRRGAPQLEQATLGPYHTWFHVRIEADLDVGKLDLYVDGQQRLKGAVGVISTRRSTCSAWA